MGAQSEMSANLVGEFVGTFLLVFTVGCNVLSGNTVWGGVSIACVLMVSIYALGGISGANFNPAVSLALALSELAGGKGINMKTLAMYMGTQIAAGIAAAFSYSALFSKTHNLSPSAGFGFLEAGLCEVLYTFMLCFVVLNVAVAKKNSPNQFYGLAIGFVIVAGAFGAGAVSGGCFNPAVAIGMDVASAGTGFGWCLLYSLAEFLGAVLAVGLFMAVRPGDYGLEEKAASPLISEFLGTFMLVLTVGLNVLAKSPSGAFSIAASLMCMIYALGDVSGAHFNPAVTFAIFVSGRAADLTPARAISYVAVQLAGGIAAAFTASAIRKGDSSPMAPKAGFGYLQAGVAEVVFTFVLCYVVLSVAVSKTTKAQVMFGLAIGACVTVGGNAIGSISGGSLNPAVSFGIAAAHLPAGGSLTPSLLFTIFELVGGGLAAGAFSITHAIDLEGDASNPLKESA